MYKFVCFLDDNATEKVSRADYIWELKQGRRGRQEKVIFAFLQSFLRYYKSFG